MDKAVQYCTKKGKNKENDKKATSTVERTIAWELPTRASPLQNKISKYYEASLINRQAKHRYPSPQIKYLTKSFLKSQGHSQYGRNF